MRSFGGYCRIAAAFGDTSLRYAHNVRVTFRTRGLGVFETCSAVACSGVVLPHELIGMRRIARQSATGQCAILSMQAMFGLAFDASVALEALSALAAFVCAPNASLRDFSENVRARSCFAFVTVQWR